MCTFRPCPEWKINHPNLYKAPPQQSFVGVSGEYICALYDGAGGAKNVCMSDHFSAGSGRSRAMRGAAWALEAAVRTIPCTRPQLAARWVRPRLPNSPTPWLAPVLLGAQQLLLRRARLAQRQALPRRYLSKTLVPSPVKTRARAGRSSVDASNDGISSISYRFEDTPGAMAV